MEKHQHRHVKLQRDKAEVIKNIDWLIYQLDNFSTYSRTDYDELLQCYYDLGLTLHQIEHVDAIAS